MEPEGLLHLSHEISVLSIYNQWNRTDLILLTFLCFLYVVVKLHVFVSVS